MKLKKTDAVALRLDLTTVFIAICLALSALLFAVAFAPWIER